MERVASLRRGFVFGAMLGVVSCAESGPEPSEGGHEPASSTAPEIAENGDLRVAARDGETVTVGVRSRSFASMDELFEFALDELGGEPVYDETGELAGVRGVSVTSGDVRYQDEDTGELFDALDLVQAYLGGAAGTIDVAGETLAVNESNSGKLGSIEAALSGDTEACVGSDCIAGHSWKTNYVVYKSIGSRTTQSRGGFSTISYVCCSAGTLVTYQGRKQCRVVTEWEPADPELGIYKPIPVAYGYRPTQTCTTSVTSNSLTLGVTALAPSGFAAASATRTEANTREIEMSAWGVGIGVDFLGIDDVSGVCGFHSGSRGGATQTGAGSANDTRCRGNVFLQGVGGAVGGSGVVLAR